VSRWPPPSPGPTPAPSRPPVPLLGPFTAIIDQVLRDERDAPPKQRHTAAQLFRRLQDEHGDLGSYPTVRRYVAAHRQSSRPTFIPLAHPPEHRLEADFGHIHVDFPDGRRLVPFLGTVWASSNAPFVLALPTARTEAILDGRVHALEFFAAVPREVWWDNPRTVATLILRGRHRQLHPRYAAWASHSTFEAKFCLPAQAHEKPDVESGVRAVQRRFATPVPRGADITELNEHMRQRCLDERRRTVRSVSGAVVIGDRRVEELAAAARLPERAFDPCIERQAVADKGQTVAFDANRYSVPRPWAFRALTVKGDVDRVVVTAGGRVIAEPPRCSDRLGPGARPGALPGDAGAATGGAGPRAGVPRLGADGSAGRTASRVGGQARDAGWDASVHPHAATAGRAPAVAGRAGDRGLPCGACPHGRGDPPADAGPGGDRGGAVTRHRSSVGQHAADRPAPQRRDPAQAGVFFKHVNLRLCEHATIADQHDALVPSRSCPKRASGQVFPSEELLVTSSSTSVPWLRCCWASFFSIADWRSSSQSMTSSS
jgi:transposase